MAKEKTEPDVLNQVLVASRKYAEAIDKFREAEKSGTLSDKERMQIQLMAPCVNSKKPQSVNTQSRNPDVAKS